MGFSSQISVDVIDGHHLLIRPSLESNFLRLRSKELWTIARASMRVSKWSMDFDPKKEPLVVPVWLSLPGLPHLLFVKEALFMLVLCTGSRLQSTVLLRSSLGLAVRGCLWTSTSPVLPRRR
ncbi:uncharacterized protein M6B38_380705 [Iris pallida]|uniref:DUF4283 domain-containing protein n=1 Tax=Iris pallida TaxID=29817 RepID=A0AAX6G970_IRIPA|nr:uncharacterized protein M6B38_380705 [Iris pallida]